MVVADEKMQIVLEPVLLVVLVIFVLSGAES
jgi:hypothetical protein